MQSPKFKRLTWLLAAVGIAGCSGDDSAPVSTVTPACTDCGALAPTLYAGRGTGVWAYTNASDQPVTVPVAIGTLPGNDVTLVFSNDSGQPLSQPQSEPVSPTAAQSSPASAQVPQMAMNRVAVAYAGVSTADRIRAFNTRGFIERLERLKARKGAPPMAADTLDGGSRLPSVIDSQPGAERPWYTDDGEPRDTTLRRQTTTRDGVVVNVWLEDSAYGPGQVTDAMLDAIATIYARRDGIRDFLVDIGGPMWGPHTESDLIAPDRQPINIVLLRLAEEGTAGYFLAANAFVNEPGTETSTSNEAVAVFLNTATLSGDRPDGMRTTIQTLVHESLHMQNFYRRPVRLGADYALADWLDEGSAVMVQDYATHILGDGYNEVRDYRLPQYLTTPMYGCSVTVWPKAGDACDGYGVWGAWGGFLNRQLGMPFFRKLLNDSTHTASEQVLDAAIRAVRPESGMVPELRRWAASVGALVPAAAVPGGYGYPARTDADYPLPAIDLQTQVATRKLPAELQDKLAPYAMAPVVRRQVKGTYRESVTVPPRTTLSVVIHDGKV